MVRGARGACPSPPYHQVSDHLIHGGAQRVEAIRLVGAVLVHVTHCFVVGLDDVAVDLGPLRHRRVEVTPAGHL